VDSHGGITVGYPADFAEQSLRSHALSYPTYPSFNNPTSHSLPIGTNSLRLSIKQETERVRGKGGMTYNPDVVPYQHWLLKQVNVSPFTSSYREQLWLGSNLLKTVTEDQIWDIVADGWEYDPPQAIDDWDADRLDAFVEAVSKALIINSAYLTIWSDGSYRIFTTNDVYRPVYLNQHHKQVEVYFLFPSLVGAVAQKNDKQFNAIPIGFLTQHTKEKQRKARMTQNFIQFKGKMADTIFRECVMIQPKPSIHDIFGYSKMQIECDTAVQKTYLRSYEFAFLHKGGVNKTLAIPNNVEQATKDASVKDALRGLWSRGLILFTRSGKPVNEQVMVAETAIPPLFFGEISSLISEDQQVSKQKVEGEAASGALGGQAPIVNEREDEKNLTSLLNILERVIRDVNDVFDGVESDVEEKSETGRVRRKPAYRVKFNKTALMSVEEYEANKAATEANQENIIENNTNNTNIKPKEGIKKQEEKPNSTSTKPRGNAVIAHSVSVTDEYTTFEGNLFAPGVYAYPETGTTDIFTPNDIKRFTENPVNRSPLEISHSENPRHVGLYNDLGYSEVIRFDHVKNQDVTRIHIKNEHLPQLIQDGIIVDNTVQLSPYFYTEQDPVSKQKYIHNLNVALLDPSKEASRGSLTGLKTEAHRVN